MSCLESSMVWAPVEAMTQVSRNAQKLVAKECGSLSAGARSLTSSVSKELKSLGDSAPLTPDRLNTKTKMQMMKTIQGMIKEAQALKRKISDSAQTSSKHAKLCSHRLHYLHEVEQLAQDETASMTASTATGQMEEEDIKDEPHTRHNGRTRTDVAEESRNAQEMDIDAADSAPEAHNKKGAVDNEEVDFAVTPRLRMDRIFADYLLRNDRPRTTALLLSSSPELQHLVDATIFASSRKIGRSLVASRECTSALAWCGENRSRLNKIGSTLEFDLRLQEFLTIVQAGKQIEAIEYARKHLAPAVISSQAASSATEAPLEDAGKNTPAAATPSARNNSTASHDGPTSTTPAAPSVVVDPARVQLLQEAMNLLVFYGFEQDDASDPDESQEDAEDAPIVSKAGAASRTATPSVRPPRAWHKYRVYWSPLRYAALARQFHSSHLGIYGLPERSALETAMHIGLACMQTGTCREEQTRQANQAKRHMTAEEEETQTDDEDKQTTETSRIASQPTNDNPPPASLASSHLSSCPACTSSLSPLCRSLPVAQRTHSRLVCRLSGRLMDDKNPPMALPNGSVYSRQAIEEMAKQNGGIVTCARTNQKFAIAQARIAYVL